MVEPQMQTRTVSIIADDSTELSGTAMIPTGGRRVPAALLLSGSGPLDRNSNMAGQRLNIASTLADALAAAGIASLRFDKRGVADSAGDYLSTGFDCETSDATSALAALRGVDGVDASRIGVTGHSVGATIAARLAARSESVAFAVLLGCAASSGADVMAWQTERIANTLPGPSWALGRRFRRKQAQLFERLDASTDDVLGDGKRAIPARWMREYRAHEPSADLAALRCPVLAVTGGKDIQVDPEETDRIRVSVTGPCTTLTPSGLTHVLRASTRQPSITHYAELLREPVDLGLVETVTTWIVNHTTETPGSCDQSNPAS